MPEAGEKAVPAAVSGPFCSIHLNQSILWCALLKILLSLFFFFYLLSKAVNLKESSPKTMLTPPHKTSGMTLTPLLL